MCAKEIRCLLTLRKKLVADERNEALDWSLQRKQYANFLTWKCRHCMWWITVSAGMWCNAVTKHAGLTGYFSQDPDLFNVCNSYIFMRCTILCLFLKTYIRQRLSVVRTNVSLKMNLWYFGCSQMITLAKLNRTQESLQADRKKPSVFNDAAPHRSAFQKNAISLAWGTEILKIDSDLGTAWDQK